jgi:ribosomal protein L24E
MAVNQCDFCGGKFGLVRHWLLTLHGYLAFCSTRCKDDHFARKQAFTKWLYPDP